MSGTPPAPRFGHTMGYLPTNNSLIIIGGRNDELCKTNGTPFLNDIFLFLLDQKFWLNVKHSVTSDKLSPIGNQCMTIITDGDCYEKVLIFGGISNKVSESKDPNEVESNLSN